MKIHQLRNATLLLEIGEHRLLVDPVLGDVGSFSAFKMFGGGRRRNPIVPLPEQAPDLLAKATGVLITHAHHVDHLDPTGVAWIKERGLKVWASPLDAPSLRKKGFEVEEVHDGIGGMRCEIIPAVHGRGPIGWLMGPVTGFFLAALGEPSIYLTSDAVLTEDMLAAVKRLQPEVIVSPAGSASFGLGPDILFSIDELITLTKSCSAQMVFNHLEAVDHCPTTRKQLRERLETEGLSSRTNVPEDGHSLEFSTTNDHRTEPAIKPAIPDQPGLQKWLVNMIAKVM
ncbi:MAG: MBL fold metallo-hydrolase [bacterium]|nr:MBL fold metallo-hydrolase [bacterium]